MFGDRAPRSLPSYGGDGRYYGYNSAYGAPSSKRSGGGSIAVMTTGAVMLLVCFGLMWQFSHTRSQIAQLEHHLDVLDHHLIDEKNSRSRLESVLDMERRNIVNQKSQAQQDLTATRAEAERLREQLANLNREVESAKLNLEVSKDEVKDLEDAVDEDHEIYNEREEEWFSMQADWEQVVKGMGSEMDSLAQELGKLKGAPHPRKGFRTPRRLERAANKTVRRHHEYDPDHHNHHHDQHHHQ